MLRPSRRLRAVASSLQVRIVLGTVAALALGVAATTYVVARQAGRETLELQRQRELAEAVHAADRLSHRVVDLQRALRALATRLDRRTVGDTPVLERTIGDEPVLDVMFAGVAVFDDAGRTLRAAGGLAADATPAGEPAPPALRELVRRSLALRRPLVSGPLHPPGAPLSLLAFTMPLQDKDGAYAVLAGLLPLARAGLLDDVAPDGAGPAAGPAGGGASGAAIVLTDASGRLLLDDASGAAGSPIASDPRFAAAFREWTAEGGAAEPSGLSFREPGVLVSVAGVAGPEWVVWRAQSSAALLAPLRQAWREALGVAAAMVLLISGLAWASLTRLLRPLERLQERARHLFDASRPPGEGWPRVGGEIGALSRVLRHVAVERVRLERARALAMSKLESVMSSAPVGIAFTRGFRFELVSAEFCRLFGRTEKSLLGRNPRELHASDVDDDRLNAAVAAAFDGGEAYVGEWRLRRADGGMFWARLRGRPVLAQDPAAGTIWTVEDISGEVAHRERLEWSATHDTLTGVGNRRAFEEALVRVFEARPHAIPAALVLIDLDRFKPVNDAAGHAAGDAVLRAVAMAIGGSVRASDTVARIGGDEFAVVLEHCAADVALRVAENVREAVHALRVPWGEGALDVGASLGVAPLTLEMDEPAAWLEAADAACYAAKAAGRGVVRSSWAGDRRAWPVTGLPDD